MNLMSDLMIEAICKERFDLWKKKLIRQHATPIITIGVGHDEEAGNITICTLSENALSNQDLQRFLLHVLEQFNVHEGDRSYE